MFGKYDTNATLWIVLSLFFSNMSLAQNTGGVFGPVVNEGHRSAQYRVTYNPHSHGVAQRLHYQQSINGDIMWRGIVGFRKTDTSTTDLNAAGGQLFWQISDDNAAYQTGMRLDVVLRDDDRPHRLGANWTNQFNHNHYWSTRFVMYSSVEVGDHRRNGVFLQTRSQLHRRLSKRRAIGFQLFNRYGSTENVASLSHQHHQLGIYWRQAIAGSWSLHSDALFGLTTASPDTEFRLWFGKRY